MNVELSLSGLDMFRIDKVDHIRGGLFVSLLLKGASAQVRLLVPRIVEINMRHVK